MQLGPADLQPASYGAPLNVASGSGALFGIKARPGYGTITISWFISACQLSLGPVVGLGDCRGFDPHAGATQHRAFVGLDVEHGSGWVRANPSCVIAPISRCFDAQPASANTGYGGNLIFTKDLGSSLEITYSFQNGAVKALPEGLRSFVPAINGKVIITFGRDGKASAKLSGKSDLYPSIEIYQRKGQSIRPLRFQTESWRGVICLTPGIKSLC